MVQISLFDLVLGPGVICCGTDQFVLSCLGPGVICCGTDQFV